MLSLENNDLRSNQPVFFSLCVLSGGGGTPSKNTPSAWAEMVDAFQKQALSTRIGILILARKLFFAWPRSTTQLPLDNFISGKETPRYPAGFGLYW